MKTKRKWLCRLLAALGILAALAGIYYLAPRLIPAERFGFAYEVSEAEATLRMKLVDTACSWAGVREDDGSHRMIIDKYNTLDPLIPLSWCPFLVAGTALLPRKKSAVLWGAALLVLLSALATKGGGPRVYIPLVAVAALLAGAGTDRLLLIWGNYEY